MKSYYFPIILTVIGGIVYQVCQKSIPKAIHPLHALIVAYSAGILVSILCVLFYPAERSFLASLREMNVAVLGVGIGAVAIEVGYLLAYRVGWNISSTAVKTSVMVALLLIPIGILVYKENCSLKNIFGILLCIFGLYLLSK